jgi:hypothetical protein
MLKMENNFIDEVLREAEEKEKKLEQAHLDLILVEIAKLEENMERNFDTAAMERDLIKNWALERNSLLQSRIDWLSKKLEKYLREEKLKTLDLPNGIIRIRKQQDQVQVIDEEKFFNNATNDLLEIIPETAKISLLKIKSWIKKTGRTPVGCEVIKGINKFSYQIKKENRNNGKGKVRTGSEQISKVNVAV